jgi:hypothetical protein
MKLFIRRKKMNKIAQYGSVVVIIVLMLGVGTVKAQTTIEGIDYVRSGPGESVTAPFIPAVPGPPGEPGADAVVTTGLYSRFVELTVSGIGESEAQNLNDAFWVFTDGAHNPITPYNDSIWYQLNVSTQTLLGWYDTGFDITTTPPTQLAKHKIVYDLDADTEVSPVYVPAYRPDHTYSIVVDLGTDVPSQVHFGVSDGIFSDNSGAYIITLYQLGIAVEIDIKPGSDPNPINPGSNGLVPVAIFSSPEFDATQVDPTSVSLAGASVAVRGKGKSMAHEEDVNGDGLVDLVVQVETQGFNDLGAGGTVELTGTTFGGENIVGYDEIIIVPPE